MFITNDSSQFPVPQELAPPGSKTWTAFEVGPPLPIFIATYSHLEPSFGMQERTLFTSDVQQLAAPPFVVPSEYKLRRIELMSPRQINRGSGWRIDSIVAIDLIETDSGGGGLAFTLGSGQELRELGVDGAVTKRTPVLKVHGA